jgi:YesN/AraC family two-component response regulator
MIQREPLKVLIVDDEWIIRDGLKSFPWQEFDCQVVGEAEDGAEGMLHAKVLKPDIILSDIKMAGMDGLTFASEMKTLDPDVEIILLTAMTISSSPRPAIKTCN